MRAYNPRRCKPRSPHCAGCPSATNPRSVSSSTEEVNTRLIDSHHERDHGGSQDDELENDKLRTATHMDQSLQPGVDISERSRETPQREHDHLKPCSSYSSAPESCWSFPRVNFPLLPVSRKQSSYTADSLSCSHEETSEDDLAAPVLYYSKLKSKQGVSLRDQYRDQETTGGSQATRGAMKTQLKPSASDGTIECPVMASQAPEASTSLLAYKEFPSGIHSFDETAASFGQDTADMQSRLPLTGTERQLTTDQKTPSASYPAASGATSMKIPGAFSREFTQSVREYTHRCLNALLTPLASPAPSPALSSSSFELERTIHPPRSDGKSYNCFGISAKGGIPRSHGLYSGLDQLLTLSDEDKGSSREDDHTM